MALTLGVCVAVAAVEFLVTRVTEHRAGRRLAAAVRAPTHVRIRSWPAAVHLRNAGERIAIRATDVPIPDRDATLSRLDVDLAAPLGRLPFGTELERLEVGGGELLAHGRLTDVTLDVS